MFCVCKKTSITMYYEGGGVSPPSSESAMTGRVVWIMQLPLSFSHVLLHGLHVDGCYSSACCLFCRRKMEKREMHMFSTKSQVLLQKWAFQLSVFIIICSNAMFVDWVIISLKHVSVWPQMASGQATWQPELIPALHYKIFLLFFFLFW